MRATTHLHGLGMLGQTPKPHNSPDTVFMPLLGGETGSKTSE